MDLLVAGDVQTIIQGHVTPKTMHSISVKAMPYALGGAAIPSGEELKIGETVIYEGVGHIFTVQKPWIGTQTLKAAFLMGIERKPKEIFKTSKPQSINALYEDLIKQYPQGFAIVGDAHFSKLSVAYLQLPPIYGENINVLHDKYWHSESLKDQEAKLFGVVLKNLDPRVFYHNPNEKENSSLPSHTHVLTPLARHLLTDSEITSGTFWIEGIDTVKSFKDMTL